jgi:hypothetical protein
MMLEALKASILAMSKPPDSTEKAKISLQASQSMAWLRTV